MEVLCNYRPVRLTWLPRKKVHQIIKQSIYKHLQDDKVIKISQHRFVKNKLCQPHLISFFDRLNGFVDKGEAADVIYLDFSRVFATVLQEIPINKLAEIWSKRINHKVYERAAKNGPKSNNSLLGWEGVSNGDLLWVWHYSVFPLLTWLTDCRPC